MKKAFSAQALPMDRSAAREVASAAVIPHGTTRRSRQMTVRTNGGSGNPPKPGQTCMVAIVGGSAAGKTWLVRHLQKALGPISTRITLDDFYRDRSHLPPARRSQINFDHPRALDWLAAERALRNLRRGRMARAPRYDFAAHARLEDQTAMSPAPVVLVEGLWLLHRASMRRLFDLKVYIDCPARLRRDRRLARDVAERGRTRADARRQFCETVAPMHARYVTPQRRWADIIIKQPVNSSMVEFLAERIRARLARFSGGEKMRVTAAQFLSSRPPHGGEEERETPVARSVRSFQSSVCLNASR